MSICRLCDLPTPEPPVTAHGVEGTFCCRGCLNVADALDGVEAVEVDAEASTPIPREIPDDAAETFLAVDGMHCTTCELFLGLRADGIDGVLAVDANYATETARVVYEPDSIEESQLPELLSGHGYTVRKRTADSNGDDPAAIRQRDTAQRLVAGGFFAMLVMPWYLFYLYPSYVGIETGILDVDATTAVGVYLPLVMLGLLTSVVLFYTGYPVLRGAWVSVRTRQPNMDLLVSIAAVSAYGYSTVALATGSTHLYYDVSVAVIMVVTLGRYYEGKIRSEATGLLSSLTTARVRSATRRTDDGRETVPVEELEAGDRVVVTPGERIPVDGIVVEGVADVDESILTGESVPVTKRPGETVIGGAVTTDAALIVEVGPNAESTVDRIATMLWGIQSDSPSVQRFVDALATVFVPVVLTLGVVVTAWQFATGGTVAAALLAGLTVLVVSCPCAMGLATPLAISGGLRDALRRGIVVANDSVFEIAPDAETIVFDKTGTITTGDMRVTETFGDERALRLAAAVERRSDHPVADAILDAVGSAVDSDAVADGGAVVPYGTDGIDSSEPLPEMTDFSRHPGEGVSGSVDGRVIVVGTPDLVRRQVGAIPDRLVAAIRRIERDGGLPVVVGWGDRGRGVIAVADREREEWETAVEAFADRDVVVLTGDSGPRVDRYRNHPSIDELFAGVPPEGKAETVRRLAATSTTVMVGDGTNDAPALAAADLGIAMGDGTARAADAADVVVLESDLTALEDVFDLASGTRRRIRENVGWALLYNAVAIPLAVVGLINPLFAAVAMAASSLIVVSNSRRPVVRVSE